MKKNKIQYNSVRDYHNSEDIVLSSSKEDLRQLLATFRNRQINRCKILNTIINKDDPDRRKKVGVYLEFEIHLEKNVKLEKFESSVATVDTKYTFHFTSGWTIYDKEKLLFEEANYNQFSSSKKIEECIQGAKLVSLTVDEQWSKAEFILDNNIKIRATNQVRGKSLKKFFTITKQPEPFIKLYDFAHPEKITYSNESFQLDVKKRRNKGKLII